MLLKALFLLIILFYVVRATRSLLRAVRNDPTARPPGELHREPSRPGGRQTSTDERSRSEENVEDAKWVDL